MSDVHSRSEPALFPLRTAFANQNFRLRLAVIIGLFLVTAFLAMRSTRNWQPMDAFTDPLVLIFPLIAVIALLLRWPALGLAGVIAAGLVIPFQIGTGTVTKINAAVLLLAMLLGLWVATMVVARKRIELAPSRAVLPLLLFLAAAVISFVVGQMPWFGFAQKASLGAQVGGLGIFILAAGGFFLVANEVRELRWLEAMTWTFLLLASAHVFIKAVPGMRSLVGDPVLERTFNNSTFWVWVYALSFSQAFFNKKLHPFWRAALVVLFLLALVASIIQERAWTSGWLPPLIAVAVILWVSQSRAVWLAFGVGALGLIAKFDSVRQLLFAGDNNYSLVTRLAAWRIIAEIVKANPLLGLGPANYYWYTPLYNIMGYTVQFNSHNNYIDLIAQVGLLGLAFFIWFALALWSLGLWLRDRVPEGFARAYVLGAMGGLAGMLVAAMLGDWLLPFIYNVGLNGFRASLMSWLFLGGLAAIEQMVVEGRLAGRPQPEEGAAFDAIQVEPELS